MTAANHQEQIMQDDRRNLGRNDFAVDEDYPQQFSIFDGQMKSVEYDSALSHSSSDANLSGCSNSSDQNAKESSISPSQMLFLPPAKSEHFDNTEPLSFDSIRLSTSSDATVNNGSVESECMSCEDETEYESRWSSDQDSSSNTGSNNSIEIVEFDVVSMREKLEAQKDFLLGSFRKQSLLPHSLTTQPKYWSTANEKPRSLKMKEKLHKFRKAARYFLNTKVFRRQPLSQRCEIQLEGYDDRVERLIVVVSQRRANSGVEVVHVSLPSFFETDRVTLPKFLLPKSQGETITVTIYGVSEQTDTQLPNFREVLLSGVCTVQCDSRSLLTGRLELQQHRPCRALTGFSKAVQSHGSSLRTVYEDSDSYIFSTDPKPVATDFTELCVLQMADHFREYLILSTSTCDAPAAFEACLSPGQFYAVCSYRLTQTPVFETFSLAAATPTVFFRAYMHKAEVKDRVNEVAELIKQDNRKKPVLLPSLVLVKPPGFDVEQLMQIFHNGHTAQDSNPKSYDSAVEEGLYFRAWDLDTGSTQADTEEITAAWCSKADLWRTLKNPQSLSGGGDFTVLPSLSVFNMSTRLYFADYWTYYDKHYVTLVLCPKGSPCHQICKQYLHKLDPYNNPFLFRKRLYDPEPSVAVYVSGDVNVEVIYSDSASIQRLISMFSENVYFSKVRVMDL